MAHEYRHQWQESVISGEIQHPLGDEGRKVLAAAAESYEDDSYSLDSYARNPQELDAEAFARIVSRAYNE